jgi:hypothetical protein
VTVVVNLGGDPAPAMVAIGETAGNVATGVSGASGAVILSTYPDPPSAPTMTHGTVLRPWEAIVYRSNT